MEFNSETELYNRLLPALKCKINDIKRKNSISYKEKDLWDYLKQTKWINSHNLSLSEMVSDILNSNDIAIDIYYQSKEEII